MRPTRTPPSACRHPCPLSDRPTTSPGRPPSHPRDLPSKDTSTHLPSPARPLSPCSCLAPPPTAPCPHRLLPHHRPALRASSGLRTFAHAERRPLPPSTAPRGPHRHGEETAHLSGPPAGRPRATADPCASACSQAHTGADPGPPHPAGAQPARAVMSPRPRLLGPLTLRCRSQTLGEGGDTRCEGGAALSCCPCPAGRGAGRAPAAHSPPQLPKPVPRDPRLPAQTGRLKVSGCLSTAPVRPGLMGREEALGSIRPIL